tara:strand:+ start:5480 stop:7192 length:1713 start_codon:yes stop_codon:yes gene_type:complete
MQTPGSQTQSDTPMIPLERRMNTAYERLLRQQNENNTTAIVNKGAEARTFGRIMLQFERLNNNMEIMQSEIRRDMRARRRYFEAEKKLLKKDSDNLESIRTGALFELRRDIGVLALALAAKDFSEGNFGNALENTGAGLAAFLPEIAIGVAGILGLSGGGRRGGGRVSPGSLMGRTRGLGGKGQIFTIAALAASLLMAGQARGDTRREQALDAQTTGVGPIVNRGDSARFRAQLDRFDAILSRFGVTEESQQAVSQIPSLPQEQPEGVDLSQQSSSNSDGGATNSVNHSEHLTRSGVTGNVVSHAANVQKAQAQKLETKSSETSAIARSKKTAVPLTNLLTPATPTSSSKMSAKIDNDIKSIVGAKAAEQIEKGNIMPSMMTSPVTPDNQVGEKVVDIRRQSAARQALTVAPPIPQEPIIPKKSPAIAPGEGGSAKSPSEISKSTSYEIPTPDPGLVALQKIDALGATKNASIQPPQPKRDKKGSWKDWLPPNPFARSKGKASTGGGAPPPNVVEDNPGGGKPQPQQSPPPPSQGIGPDGDPVVSTKFTRSGGAIDKFDNALSLKSYAAL